MRPRVLSVDDDGLHLERGFAGPLDVHFDGWRGWSVAVPRQDGDEVLVAWPRRLKEKLDGRAVVSVTHEEKEIYSCELAFGSGEGRVELVDRHGNPVTLDKWGLFQRPFDGRREAGAVEAMTTMAERVLDIMREQCGLEGWIAFGTLLGAARSGKVIGHDSDIDLCFLSERATPAEMAVELWDLARTLTDAGISVKHKTASFLTVVYDAPDGGEDGIDIYTCFYVGDLLHETATVRAPVPREAVLPLRVLEFEGRDMPAPADPDQMLSVSYGPNWKVPDPSFRHLPGPEITHRFNAWFGSLMTHRRDWTQVNGENRVAGARPSGFARWVAEQVAEQVGGSPRVHDIGSGASGDLDLYAERGWKPIGYDFAHPGKYALAGTAAVHEDAFLRPLNLLDLRDAYASGALAARQGRRAVVTARRVLEAVPARGHEGFWRFASMALARGGRAYLEGVSRSAQACQEHADASGEPRGWSVDPFDVARDAVQAGGRVVHREGFAAASRASRGGSPARWRMIVEWTAQEDRER